MIEIRGFSAQSTFQIFTTPLDHAVAIARWIRVDGHGPSRVLVSSGRRVGPGQEPSRRWC
jgi:hypothetical protein